jgi:hypothetical protein
MSAVPVVLFSLAFAFGLVLYLIAPASAASSAVLDAGILLLMISPGVRVAAAAVERIGRKDWTFIALVAAIVAELLFVVWRAASRG